MKCVAALDCDRKAATISMNLPLDAPFEIDLESGVLKFGQIPMPLAQRQSVSVFLATDAGATPILVGNGVLFYRPQW